MPQIVEKRIRGGICQFIDMQRQIINTNVIKESSYLIYWDLNNIYMGNVLKITSRQF